jgi:putative ABC transport system substrate-binding protein
MATAEPSRPIRIGALTEAWGITPPEIGLRDGLVALGYREKEHFIIDSRFTQGDSAALPAAARQLVKSEVDLIFTVTARAAQAAQRATSHIPIVFAGMVDPLKFGLVQSFARPGGNVTGVADLPLELGPKRLEVFRQLIPSLKRVLFPYDVTDASTLVEVQVYRDAARRLGIVLVEKAITTKEEAQATLAKLRPGEVDGILAPRCCSWNIPGFILEIAPHKSLPTMFQQAFWVERDALASYGPDHYSSGIQAARLVDKILKGGSPADLPVEVNPKIKFVINLKTAKVLGLTIAPEVLYQADRLVR